MVKEPEQLIEELRNLLLEEDRKSQRELLTQVKALIDETRNREKINQRVGPAIEEKLAELKKNFPKEYGPVIAATIKTQIQESKDEMIDALYPIIGKLIKKYIVMEIEQLKESIDRRLSNTFSVQRLRLKWKSTFSGVSETDLVAAELLKPMVEEVFLVQQDSGLLLGSFSRNQTLDQDMLAGMLTAIKGFGGEVHRTHEQLETIEYETYKILITNFQRVYLALVVSGVVDATFEKQMDERAMTFANEVLSPADMSLSEDILEAHFSQQLQAYFA